MKKFVLACMMLVGALTVEPFPAQAQPQNSICPVVGCFGGPNFCADVYHQIWVEGFPIWVETLCRMD